jgi:hypothetical protein
MLVYVPQSLLPVFGSRLTRITATKEDAKVLLLHINADFSSQSDEYQSIIKLPSISGRLVIIVDRNQDRNLIPADLEFSACYSVGNKKKLDELVGQFETNQPPAPSEPKAPNRMQILKEERRQMEEKTMHDQNELKRKEYELHLEKCKLEKDRKEGEAWLEQEKLRLAASAVDGIGLEFRNQCVICLDAAISVIYVPCRHACTCYQCCVALLQQRACCPMCRAPIERVEPIFIA